MTDFRDRARAATTEMRAVFEPTPLQLNAHLSERFGADIWLKREDLSPVRSYKLRGAFNAMRKLPDQKLFVCASAGNHAQGVAAAGSMLGVQTTIVMPEDAPAMKLNNTRRLGGHVVTYDRYTDSREAIAERIAEETGGTVAPSFNHPHIIAGQGTVGLEIRDDLLAAGIVPDQLLVCCGGGGLTAGSALALRSAFPDVAVHPVEPVNFDDTTRSLQSGERETNDPSARSICDAILTDSPGDLTFEIMRHLDASGLVVSDDEAREAMRFAFQHLKLVVEPGGSVALAAALAHKLDTKGRVTVLTISGGNVDPEMFGAIQAERG